MFVHRRIRATNKTLVEKGFTLVELLVIIVILVILAAVLVFAVGGVNKPVGGTSKTAAINACFAERSTVESAVEAYKAQAADGETGDGVDTDNLTTGIDGKPLLKHDPHYWTVSNGVLSRTAGDPPPEKCNATT